MNTAPQSLQGVQVGPHQLGVPGRHEADALTDVCPQLDCATRVRPAAVLDEVKGRSLHPGRAESPDGVDA